MPVGKENTGHDQLVNFMSDTYYNGGKKEEISNKLLTDKNSFNKALTDIHQKKYSDVPYPEFRGKYIAKYGDPFQKKSPNQSNQEQNVPSGENLQQPAPPQEKPLSNPGINDTPLSHAEQGFMDYKIAKENNAKTFGSLDEAVKEKPLITPEQKQKNDLVEAGKSALSNGDTGQDRVSNFMGHVDQALANLPADILQGGAVLMHPIDKGINTLLGKEPTPIKESALYKAGEWYKNTTKELFPTNPAFQNDLDSQVGDALGNLTSLAMSGGLSAEAKAIGEFTKASNVLAAGGKMALKTLATPPSLIGATQMGVSEFNAAKEAGADDETAFNSFLKNAGAGSVLEAIPIMKFWKRLDQTTGGGVKNLLKNGAVQGFEEGTTELAQQVFSNVSAGQTYDTTRKWYDGMSESGGIGFGLGFLLGGMGTSLRKKQSEAKTPEEKAEIQKAIDFVDTKSEELKTKTEQEDATTTRKTEPIIQHQGDNGQLQNEGDNRIKQTEEQNGGSETSDSNLIQRGEKELTSKRAEILANLPIDEETGQPIIDEKAKQELADIHNQITTLNEKGKTTEKTNKEAEAPAVQEGQQLEEKLLNQKENGNQDIEGVQDNIRENEKEPVGNRLNEAGSGRETEADRILQTHGGEQETVTPPVEPPTQKKDEVNDEGNRKKRKFAEQILNDPDISDEIKTGLSEDAKTYIPTTNKISNKEANAIVETKGTKIALVDLMDTHNEIKSPVRVALAESIIKQSNKAAKEATTEQDKNYHLDNSIKAAEFISKHLTELGQGVQAASIYNRLSPEGIYRYVKKQINKNSDVRLAPHEEQITNIHKILNNLNEESIKKVLEHPEIRKALEGMIYKAPTTQSKRKTIQDAIAFLETKKINLKGQVHDITYALPAHIYNGAISTIQDGLQAGDTITKAVKRGIKWAKDNHKEEWDEKGFASQFDVDLAKYEAHLDPERAIARALKEQGTKIAEVVKSHYTKVDKTKQSIVDKLIKDAGLDPKAASELAASIQKKFNEIATKAKEQAIKKESSLVQRISAKKNSIDQKLIELSNLKALDQEDVRNVFSEKLGIKSLTDAEGKRIFQLADKIQEADNFAEETQKNFTKENIKKYQQIKKDKQKAINEISDILDSHRLKDAWDTLGTVLQGNLLSPISIATNIYSNSLLQPLRFLSRGIANIIDIGISKTFNRPRKIDIISANKGYWQGVKQGLSEGFKELKSGSDIEEIQRLEINRGFKPLRSLVKGVNPKESQIISERVNNLIEGTFGMHAEAMFRLLNLGDKPFLRAAEFAKANEIADLKGFKGKERDRFLMFPDEESAKQIKEAGREATFKSENGLGDFFSKIINSFSEWLNKIPVIGGALKLFLKTQVPFVKTPVNIISETFDYALPALSLTKALYYGGKSKDREKALTYLGKASVGLVLQTVIDKLLELGIISGEPDKEEKSLQYQAFPPFGINVSAFYRLMNGGDPATQKGDKWSSYNKTGVLYTIAAMRSKMSNEEKDQADEYNNKLIGILKDNISAIPTAAGAALESSFLLNANTLLNAMKGNEYDVNKWAANTFRAVTSIPIPNTFNTFSRASRENLPELSDPKLLNTFSNVLKDKLFMADELPSKIDLWGNPIKQTPEGGMNKYLYHLFDVTKTRDISADPLSFEVFKLWNRTKNSEGIPSVPKRTINIGDDKIKLTPKQYEEFQKHVGMARKAFAEAYINSSQYESDSDEEKIINLRDAYKDGYEEGKDSFLNQVINVNQ